MYISTLITVCTYIIYPMQVPKSAQNTAEGIKPYGFTKSIYTRHTLCPPLPLLPHVILLLFLLPLFSLTVHADSRPPAELLPSSLLPSPSSSSSSSRYLVK